MKFIENIFRTNKRSTDTVTDGQTTVKVTYSGERKKYSSVTSPSEGLKNSVVYRGISILSDSVASIPCNVYHRNKQGYWDLDYKNPLYNVLTRRANLRMNSYELFEGIIVQMILKGDAYVLITRNIDYDPVSLTLLYPGSVFYNVEKNTYTVTDVYNKVSGIFSADKIIHLKHKSLSTLKGESILTYAGKTIGLANAADSEALASFQTGGKMKGIITTESSLAGFSSAIDSQVDTIRDNLQNEIDSGKDILTLQSGADFKPISMTMRDLQITDMKNITLGDLARYFGISLGKLGILGGNYKVSEEEQINFYTDTLNPILCKIEHAFNTMLINDSVAHKYKIEFDRTVLPYYEEILNNYKTMMELGLYSINDVRKILNRQPVDGGDTVFVSTNTQAIDNPKVTAEKTEINTNEGTESPSETND